MTFRAQLQLGFAALAVLTVGGLTLGVRREMSQRLTAEYQDRVRALAAVAQENLSIEGQAIGTRLQTLGAALSNDNRFRLSIAGGGTDSTYVVDYAGNAMRLAGLSMLQLESAEGRIMSSGHFREEFDRLDPDLPRLIAAAPGGMALTSARTAEGPFLALVRADSARVGGRRLALVGGERVDQAFLRRLAREADLTVTLSYPGGSLTSADSGSAIPDNTVAADVALPFVLEDSGTAHLDTARLAVSYSLAPVAALRQSVTTWSLLAGLAAIAVALLVASALAGRLSHPLTELATKTAALDLTRLDVDFATGRSDEVGRLAQVLETMAARLRKDASQLRDAERRATVGELARQVNHDIKNGLVPIRNVLQHLAQVAADTPAELPAVFAERKGTLDSGIKFLETLAANYARLTPRMDGGASNLAGVVDEAVSAVHAGQAALRVDVPSDLPPVRADAVVLRRILQNLVTNALDSLPGGRGSVTVAARQLVGGTVRLTVTDTGAGMTPDQLERAFEDFYTTKQGGTGLGLSVVRRLVADVEGELKVDTVPGSGTTVTISLPTAVNRSGSPAESA